MLEKIAENIIKYGKRNAFYIKDKFYTYNDFRKWDVMTAQRWTDNGWDNYWKRKYEYDN